MLVCCGVIVLRRSHPDLARPFKMPAGELFAAIGALSCGALIAFLPWETHLRFVLWLLAGMIIYFAYSKRHSKLARENA